MVLDGGFATITMILSLSFFAKNLKNYSTKKSNFIILHIVELHQQ